MKAEESGSRSDLTADEGFMQLRMMTQGLSVTLRNLAGDHWKCDVFATFSDCPPNPKPISAVNFDGVPPNFVYVFATI